METKEITSEVKEPAPENAHIDTPVDTGGLKENTCCYMQQQAAPPQFTRSGRMLKPRDILDL